MTTADQLRECADRLWARPEYPTLLRKAADELDRLQSRFDSKKFTHRQDCCGAQIETRCLGCAMADLNCSMAEDDTMRAEIARLTKQNSAYATLVKSQEVQLSFWRNKAVENQNAASVLESELEANAILTDENAGLDKLIGKLRAIVEKSSGES
mgnify:CR=1 FL=1